MATYWLAIESIGRSTGRRAVDAAAYRSGERLVDGTSGRVYDHSARRDVVHSEIVLPARFAGAAMAWARDRASLWTAAERAERQRNARVAREFAVSLPHELEPARRIELARAFAGRLAERYGVAVDLAVHEPRPDGDPRNHHAHLLATTRAVEPARLGAKAGLDMRDGDRTVAGLPGGRAEFHAVRALWSELANEALREAGLDVRIDHRSLAAQGIARAPRHLPWSVYRQAMRQRGEAAPIATPPVARAASQTAARATIPGVAAAVATSASAASAASAAGPSAPAVRPTATLDELRRAAVAAWRRYRGLDAAPDAPSAGAHAGAPLQPVRSPARGAEPAVASPDAFRARSAGRRTDHGIDGGQ